MSIQTKAGAGLIGLCALYTVSAVAEISVSTRIDDTTGGDWRATYGSCYSVVPWAPRAVHNPEFEVGPDFEGDQPQQYVIPIEPPQDAFCISGAATDKFDFRIFTAGAPEPNPGHAFVWGFHDPNSGEQFAVLPGTPQWNACRGIFYPATYDSDMFDFDPLSGEIKLETGGSATVAFYFLSEADVCRSQDYRLFIDGNKVAEGNIKDLSVGKYLVFDIDGLPEGGSLIRLDTEQIADGNSLAFCQNQGSTFGLNSHLAGIFVDGTEACAPPGGITRTLGYWKTHPDVIDGSFDGDGGFESLLPLNFCGEEIAVACDAVKFLSQGGGGINNFKRQGMAALLNCEAFGCSSEISTLIADGSAACGAGTSFDFGGAGSTLDEFNNSGDDLALPFDSPSAQPHACSSLSPKQLKKLQKLESLDSLSKKQAKKLEKLLSKM